jgi:hypothetical protein
MEHYRVNKGPPLVSILIQMNQIHTLPPHPLKILSNVFVPLRQVVSSLQVSQPKFCMHFSFVPRVLRAPPTSSTYFNKTSKKHF